MSDWGEMPTAYGPEGDASEVRPDEFPIIGEEGEKGKSSRARAGEDASVGGEDGPSQLIKKKG